MRATGKYLLGRVGLFCAVGLLLWPTGLNPFVIAMAALLVSFLLSLWLLRGWRKEMVNDVDGAVQRRREQKEDLRAALAGEDEE